MILNETIKIKVNGKMVKKYKELGFDVKQHDYIDLPVEHLSKYSHQVIMCACDICGEKKEIKYNNYSKYIEKDPNNQYTCKICNIEKRKKTCLEKYGTDFVAKLETSKIKSKKTMEENGTEPFFCSPRFKNRMIEIYGVDNPSKEKNMKKKKEDTCYENYGVRNPSHSPEIQNQKEQTCFKNYGVRNPSHSPEIHKKQQSGFILKHYNGLSYRGSYEKHFIDYCVDKNIKIENFKGTIPYNLDGVDRKYFPDFFIKERNMVVEIKSKYTYNFDIPKNEAKKEAAISNGFNFIFIIDKDYNSLIMR